MNESQKLEVNVGNLRMTQPFFHVFFFVFRNIKYGTKMFEFPNTVFLRYSRGLLSS
jgi:hypothetical protein